MELDKKPKCRGCNNRGDEDVYYYQKQERGSGGYLWHYSCYLKIAKEVLK